MRLATVVSCGAAPGSGHAHAYTLTRIHIRSQVKEISVPSRAGYFCVLCGVAVTWEKEKTPLFPAQDSKKCPFQFIGLIVNFFEKSGLGVHAGDVLYDCIPVAEGSPPPLTPPKTLRPHSCGRLKYGFRASC